MYFELYDGEAFITFDIVYLDEKKMEVQFAVTNRGKISFVTYDLRESDKGMYFEYGCDYQKIYINDFKED